MLAFPSMLLEAAKQAGIKTPPDFGGQNDVDFDEWDETKYPHWTAFCNVQLCRPVAYHGEHWDNAKIIAGLSIEQITRITLEELIALGLSYRT